MIRWKQVSTKDCKLIKNIFVLVTIIEMKISWVQWVWKIQSLVNQCSRLQFNHEDKRTLQYILWKCCWKVLVIIAGWYKNISKSLNIPQSSVKSIIKKWNEYGTCVNLPRADHPHKLNDHARRRLVREANKTLITSQQLKALHGSAAKRKPFMNKAHLMSTRVYPKACGRFQGFLAIRLEAMIGGQQTLHITINTRSAVGPERLSKCSKIWGNPGGQPDIVCKRQGFERKFTFQQDNDPTLTAKTTQKWHEENKLNFLASKPNPQSNRLKVKLSPKSNQGFICDWIWVRPSCFNERGTWDLTGRRVMVDCSSSLPVFLSAMVAAPGRYSY